MTIDINNLPPIPNGVMEPSNTDTQKDLLRTKLRNEFKEICPIEYLETDPNHAGMPPKSTQERVLAWKPCQGSGMLLCGSTGLGKTRLAWMLVKRLMCNDVVRCRVINDPSLSREYSKRVGDGTASDWIERMIKTPVLFVDDFGKSSPTSRYKEAFYDIIENRTNQRKPMIITTQWDREKIVQQFGDEDGSAIVRRLLEFCEIVGFKKSN